MVVTLGPFCGGAGSTATPAFACGGRRCRGTASVDALDTSDDLALCAGSGPGLGSVLGLGSEGFDSVQGFESVPNRDSGPCFGESLPALVEVDTEMWEFLLGGGGVGSGATRLALELSPSKLVSDPSR
mmetsp:Transcript_40656/g.87936  ORF Transcript_40656/g.87936 Transcript_40656/m.87936 type:complete len:128 (+) Transcript_40656:221-604(+)